MVTDFGSIGLSHFPDDNECLRNQRDQRDTKITALLAENNTLRALWANSEMDCVYCGLSKANMSKCLSGFPGCARADDMYSGQTQVEEPHE